VLADLVQVLGARLRDGRQREGLSLQRVEQRSGGRCKAVVVGSYERGDRAVTVQKLAELARFYGVPMSLLLPPEDLGSDDGVAIPIVLNLDRLDVLPRRKAGPLTRYAADIAHRRGEHGTLLRIRSTDIDSLADLYAISPRARRLVGVVGCAHAACGVSLTEGTGAA